MIWEAIFAVKANGKRIALNYRFKAAACFASAFSEANSTPLVKWAGGACTSPGISMDAGETLWEPLNPPQPAAKKIVEIKKASEPSLLLFVIKGV